MIQNMLTIKFADTEAQERRFEEEMTACVRKLFL